MPARDAVFLALRPVDGGAIEHCPGLKVAAGSGVFFTDSFGRDHDLEREPLLRPKQAAADPRLCGISARCVRAAIGRGEIYPVLRRNSRVLLIFDCALTEWRCRRMAGREGGVGGGINGSDQRAGARNTPQ